MQFNIYQVFTINGNMSAGNVGGPGEKREMFKRSRQKAKQQKEEFDKRIEEHIYLL